MIDNLFAFFSASSMLFTELTLFSREFMSVESLKFTDAWDSMRIFYGIKEAIKKTHTICKIRGTKQPFIRQNAKIIGSSSQPEYDLTFNFF